MGLRNVILILLVLLIESISFGCLATSKEVLGDINEKVTWGKSEDTILVVYDVAINPGGQVIIEPGTKVIFKGYYTITIFGNLLALGTEEDSILFTIYDSTNFSDYSLKAGGWGGLRFDTLNYASSYSRLSFCTIEYAKHIDDQQGNGGAIGINNYSDIEISHCVIRNNYARKLGGGIYINKSLTPKIINTFIVNNESRDNGGGIYASRSKLELLNNIIVSNSADNSGSGIYLKDCFTSNVFNNNICDNRDGVAVGIHQSTYDFNIDTIKMYNNIIYSNEGNIQVEITKEEQNGKYYVFPLFRNSCVQNGEYGIAPSDIPNPTNSEDMINFISVEYKNISFDPNFVVNSGRITPADYKLKSTSRCIDAGIREVKKDTINKTLVELWRLDILSNYRKWKGAFTNEIDIGAIEFNSLHKFTFNYNIEHVTDANLPNGKIEFSIHLGRGPYIVTVYNHLYYKSIETIHKAVFDSLKRGYYYFKISDSHNPNYQEVEKVEIKYEIDQPYTISGKVHTSKKGLLKEGYVIAFRDNIEKSFYEIVQIENGNFDFVVFDTGNYHLFAIPMNTKKEDYPVFYTDYADWKKSNTLEIIYGKEHISDVDIRLNSRLILTKGFSKLQGRIYYEDSTLFDRKAHVVSYSNQFNDNNIQDYKFPLYAKNIPVLLLRNDNIVDWTMSDSSGRFIFDSLQDGNYTLYVQKLGAKHINTPVIDLAGINSPQPDSIAIIFQETDIITKVFRAGLDKSDFCDFNIYPNPVETELTIQTNNIFSSTLDARIFNLSGSLILQESFNKTFGPTTKTINLNSLNRGVYTIEIRDESCKKIFKMIK